MPGQGDIADLSGKGRAREVTDGHPQRGLVETLRHERGHAEARHLEAAPGPAGAGLGPCPSGRSGGGARRGGPLPASTESRRCCSRRCTPAHGRGPARRCYRTPRRRPAGRGGWRGGAGPPRLRLAPPPEGLEGEAAHQRGEPDQSDEGKRAGRGGKLPVRLLRRARHRGRRCRRGRRGLRGGGAPCVVRAAISGARRGRVVEKDHPVRHLAGGADGVIVDGHAAAHREGRGQDRGRAHDEGDRLPQFVVLDDDRRVARRRRRFRWR